MTLHDQVNLVENIALKQVFFESLAAWTNTTSLPLDQSSNPQSLTVPARLATHPTELFSQIDSLVQRAIDADARFDSINVLLHIVDATHPDTWSTTFPDEDEGGNVEERAKEYNVMVNWAIGAMSIDLIRADKLELASLFPERFGKDGSSSRWV
jgi:hypothetical protein